MPGCVMAMGRLNRPSLMIYGGTIRAGPITGRSSTSFPRFRVTVSTSREASVKSSVAKSSGMPGAHTWIVWRRYLNQLAPLLF